MYYVTCFCFDECCNEDFFHVVGTLVPVKGSKKVKLTCTDGICAQVSERLPCATAPGAGTGGQRAGHSRWRCPTPWGIVGQMARAQRRAATAVV